MIDDLDEQFHDVQIAQLINRETRTVRIVIDDPSVPKCCDKACPDHTGRKVIFNRRAITTFGFNRNRRKALKILEREAERVRRIR